jgi:hypothetical protein
MKINPRTIMKSIARKVFYFTLVIYLILLVTLPYVSVYTTYAAIPIILISWYIGFSKVYVSMHSNSKNIFVITLFLWIVTFFTVSYVGVYLIWIAGPILLVSGFISWFTKSEKA